MGAPYFLRFAELTRGIRHRETYNCSNSVAALPRVKSPLSTNAHAVRGYPQNYAQLGLRGLADLAHRCSLSVFFLINGQEIFASKNVSLSIAYCQSIDRLLYDPFTREIPRKAIPGSEPMTCANGGFPGAHAIAKDCQVWKNPTNPMVTFVQVGLRSTNQTDPRYNSI